MSDDTLPAFAPRPIVTAGSSTPGAASIAASASCRTGTRIRDYSPSSEDRVRIWKLGAHLVAWADKDHALPGAAADRIHAPRRMGEVGCARVDRRGGGHACRTIAGGCTTRDCHHHIRRWQRRCNIRLSESACTRNRRRGASHRTGLYACRVRARFEQRPGRTDDGRGLIAYRERCLPRAFRGCSSAARSRCVGRGPAGAEARSDHGLARWCGMRRGDRDRLGNNARRSRTRRRPQRPACLAVHKIRCTRSDQCRHEPLARPLWRAAEPSRAARGFRRSSREK